MQLYGRKYPYFIPYDLRQFYNSISIWKKNILFAILYSYGYENLKFNYLFQRLIFPNFFLTTYFPIRLSQNSSMSKAKSKRLFDIPLHVEIYYIKELGK